LYLAYTRNILFACGKFIGQLSIDLNAPKGIWKITTRNIISSLLSTITFEVR